MELLKKKFMLVKILAVILGIEVILVLTIPPIIKMFKQSSEKNWNKMLYQFEEVIKTNTSTIDPLSNVYKITLRDVCVDNVAIKCYKPSSTESRYLFTFTGENQHKWRSAIMKCDGNGVCEITSNRVDVD